VVEESLVPPLLVERESECERAPGCGGACRGEGTEDWSTVVLIFGVKRSVALQYNWENGNGGAASLDEVWLYSPLDMQYYAFEIVSKSPRPRDLDASFQSVAVSVAPSPCECSFEVYPFPGYPSHIRWSRDKSGVVSTRCHVGCCLSPDGFTGVS